MIQIEVDNVKSKILNMERDYEIALGNELVFYIQVFGKEPYERRMFNRKTKLVYTGLLPYVVDFCNEHKLPFHINDNRVIPEQDGNFSLVEYIDEAKKIKLEYRPYQKELVDNCPNRAILQAATGAGKAMPLDTDILTPEGFVQLRDIHVGSIVYDEQGNETKVTAEYPQEELKQEWEITFDDDTKIKCCKDHMWKFMSTNEEKKWQEDTIENIAKQYDVHNDDIIIPVCKPIAFSKKYRTVPSHVFGMLLGTCMLNKSSFLLKEASCMESFRKYMTKMFGVVNTDTIFIPNVFKMSSVKDRLDLIQGLIDMCGTVEDGYACIHNVNERLTNDIQFVVRSLGYRTAVSKISDYRYDLYIHKYNSRTSFYENNHNEVMKIISIEKLDTKSEMKCLTVDSPCHTFICKDFVVTHNTFMMAALIAKFNVKPVCIFADKITLCVQLKEEMEKFLGVEVGLVGGGFNDYKDITVISLQSADKEYIKNAHLCLWDECHHIPSLTAESVAKECVSAYYRIGVSATPWRDAGDDMLIEAVLSRKDKSINITASKLIELGYLIKPDIYFIPIKQVFKGKNYNDIYNQAIVDNEARNTIIYKVVQQMHKRNKKILILIKNIKHGEKIQKALLKRLGEKTKGIVVKNPKTNKDNTIRVKNVEFLSGSDNGLRRKAVMEAVKQGECDILIASTIADEGLDLPILDTLILAGGGKSSTRAFQRIGRVLRLYKGKTKALVFDFIDYTPMLRRHSRTRQKLYQQEELWDLHKLVINPRD